MIGIVEGSEIDRIQLAVIYCFPRQEAYPVDGSQLLYRERMMGKSKKDDVEDDPRWWGVVFFLGRCMRLQHKDNPEMLDTINDNWKYMYGDYLKSHQWKDKAKQAKERAGNRCQLCNSPNKLQVHHRTYERIGLEDNSDLIVLCDSCHRKFHFG